MNTPTKSNLEIAEEAARDLAHSDLNDYAPIVLKAIQSATAPLEERVKHLRKEFERVRDDKWNLLARIEAVENIGNGSIEELGKEVQSIVELICPDDEGEDSVFVKVKQLRARLEKADNEINKWKTGQLLELGDDFGQNPITLINLLKSKLEKSEAELTAYREGGLTEEILRRNDGFIKVGKGCEIAIAGTTYENAELAKEVRQNELTDEIILGLKLKLEKAEGEKAQIFDNCKVVYWPKDGSYPIEHDKAQNKIMEDQILEALNVTPSRLISPDHPVLVEYINWLEEGASWGYCDCQHPACKRCKAVKGINDSRSALAKLREEVK